MCHVKISSMLGLYTRRLFGRLARAMTTDVIIKISRDYRNLQIEYYRIITVG